MTAPTVITDPGAMVSTRHSADRAVDHLDETIEARRGADRLRIDRYGAGEREWAGDAGPDHEQTHRADHADEVERAGEPRGEEPRSGGDGDQVGEPEHEIHAHASGEPIRREASGCQAEHQQQVIEADALGGLMKLVLEDEGRGRHEGVKRRGGAGAADGEAAERARAHQTRHAAEHRAAAGGCGLRQTEPGEQGGDEADGGQNAEGGAPTDPGGRVARR